MLEPGDCEEARDFVEVFFGDCEGFLGSMISSMTALFNIRWFDRT